MKQDIAVRDDARTKVCTVCGQEKGLKHFYQHPRGRFGVSARCRPCVILKAAEWAQANAARRREIRLKWNAANRAQKRASAIALRNRKKAADPEGFSEIEAERARNWRQNNPEKTAQILQKQRAKRLRENPAAEHARTHAASVKRRARIAAVGGAGISGSDIEAMLRHQKGRCWWCQRKFRGRRYHIDHRFPLSRGGPHDPSNTVLSCARCNLKKGAKMPWQFAGRLL